MAMLTMKSLSILLLILLILSCPVLAAEKKLAPFENKTEWLQLSRLWRDLSGYWVGKNIDRNNFTTLREDIKIALLKLSALEADGLPPAAGKTLDDLFQQRYQFVKEQRLEPGNRIMLANLDSHLFTARTQIENDLAHLLWPSEGSGIEPKKIQENVRKDLLLQLEFIRRTAEANTAISQNRVQTEKKQANGEKVDWDQFKIQSYNLIRGLIDQYTTRRLKPTKETQDLYKLILSLTEEPLPEE